MKDVRVLLHVVCEEVCGGAHQEDVAVLGGVQPAAGQRGHALVDVQEGQVLAAAAAAAAGVGDHPAGGGAQGLVRVVDEHLKEVDVNR